MLSASRRRAGSDRPDEDGVILVIWVVALVAIMGLVAMAIDLGNIAQTKQHTANAAQAAVLSAVTDLEPLAPGGGGVPATVELQAVTDAETYLHLNYPSLPASTDPNALTTYSSCGNALPSSLYFVAEGSVILDCFGFFDPANPADNSISPNAMAVAVPARTVDYTFGRAAGLTSQKVSSVAFASLQTASNGHLLPFGYGTGGGYGLQCLKDSTDTSSPCPNFSTSSGKFGVLNDPRYQILTASPYADVSNGSSNSFTETNIDLGIDHPLTPYSSGATNVCDWTSVLVGCSSDNATAPYLGANYVNPGTGQSITEVTGPLFTGNVSSPNGCVLGPRFSHPNGFQASDNCSKDNPPGPNKPYLSTQYEMFGNTNHYLNGVPLYKYVKPSSDLCPPDLSDPKSVAMDYQLTVSGGTVSYAWQSWDTCFNQLLIRTASIPNSPPIFSHAIEKSPRFGIVPVVSSSNGGNVQRITNFYGIYLDLAFKKSTGNDKVGSVWAWVFPLRDIAGQNTSGWGLGTNLGGNYVANLCAFSINC